MNKLRLSSFGLRGFVGESLSPTTVMDLASAFASFVDGGKVLLGRDTRDSSPMIYQAAVAGLLSAGCEVLDYGICPTPLLQFEVQRQKAAGAVSISGGHNAQGWNAVTLVGHDGAYLDPSAGEVVLDRFHARDFLKQDWRHIGRVEPVAKGYAASYFDALASHVNVEAIRAASFSVLIDPVGGAGCPFLWEFAERLGFKLLPVNAEPTGYLAREPEPRPRSALQMASIIRHLGGSVGFVLSSDMGRMSIVTEAGEPASEEYTFALIANHVLAIRNGTLVTNVCTSRTIDDVAATHGAPVIKTRVGQVYVSAALADEQGLLGGEGSGSVMLPAFSQAYDGFLMMALILDAMAKSGEPVSALLQDLPRYAIVKRSIPCSSRVGYRGLEAIKSNADFLKHGEVNTLDGLRVDWESGWVHVRQSQTQQMLRVIAEARRREVAQEMADQAARIIQEAL